MYFQVKNTLNRHDHYNFKRNLNCESPVFMPFYSITILKIILQGFSAIQIEVTRKNEEEILTRILAMYTNTQEHGR